MVLQLEMRPKCADERAKFIGPDQTVPLGGTESVLFAETFQKFYSLCMGTELLEPESSLATLTILLANRIETSKNRCAV